MQGRDVTDQSVNFTQRILVAFLVPGKKSQVSQISRETQPARKQRHGKLDLYDYDYEYGPGLRAE